ncbi:RNA polymerase sigma factor SigJ [Streptomyces longispororuber]|uniref:RNA polymerase sigma factor SigJ n=1 Tax=Streptomyces longispororuber TaxID=68230 RepID=UPI00210D0489|nr:RNA polymerase sigma factor SigJ [Streptomyces longispororuber]MCQ4214500.1 RNA polymerase sigma factor SigJ [Streptomyces longispororuber]
MSERRALTNLAYRLLGSLADAEDVVQETYARWYAMTPERQAEIASPGGWLTKVAGRICLDQLRSARARRERYVGEWLPEPVPGGAGWSMGRSSAGPDGTADPADRVTLDESVTMAFLVVLDSLTPAERVAFVLHDVFRYPFADIADVVGRAPAACRQLATSARRHIRAAQAPVAPATAERAAVVSDFRQAWQAQDIKALVGLLDPDAKAVTDTGGLVQAGARSLAGAEAIAQGLVELFQRVPDLTVEERMVNGLPGLVIRQAGVTVTVMALEVSGDRVTDLWAMRNPEKLRMWTAGTGGAAGAAV